MASTLITGLAVMSLVILLLVFVLRRLDQPNFVAYLLAGILLGPEVLNVFERNEIIISLGELGVVLLMFFVGAEINLPSLSKNFARPLIAVLTQLLFSFAFVYILSFYFKWDYRLTVLLSFIVSLSSSAIVFQYLSKTGQMHTSLGLLSCGVLLVQDLIVVPMLLVLNLISGNELSGELLFKVCFGAVLSGLFLWAAVAKKLLRIPFKDALAADHDLQVFVGFLLCFGMAWLTWYFGLSPALGAFLAGIIIGQDTATDWLDRALIPFRVFFMAFFFISVGLQLNLYFFRENLAIVASLTLAVLLANSLINTLVFRITGYQWRESVYAGALLSQIGEFSFVLITLAKSLHLVSKDTHQTTLCVIALSMMLSSLWINIIQKFIYKMPATR
jgi:CPA2 family monovalent cation:H+ antiporter-2